MISQPYVCQSCGWHWPTWRKRLGIHASEPFPERLTCPKCGGEGVRDGGEISDWGRRGYRDIRDYWANVPAEHSYYSGLSKSETPKNPPETGINPGESKPSELTAETVLILACASHNLLWKLLDTAKDLPDVEHEQLIRYAQARREVVREKGAERRERSRVIPFPARILAR